MYKDLLEFQQNLEESRDKYVPEPSAFPDLQVLGDFFYNFFFIPIL